MKTDQPYFKAGLVALFILISQFLFSRHHISGEIKGQNGEAIAYANVLLLSSTDSSLVTGNLTNDAGKYLLENVAPGSYIINATMIGYQDVYDSSVFPFYKHYYLGGGDTVRGHEERSLGKPTRSPRKVESCGFIRGRK